MIEGLPVVDADKKVGGRWRAAGKARRGHAQTAPPAASLHSPPARRRRPLCRHPPAYALPDASACAPATAQLVGVVSKKDLSKGGSTVKVGVRRKVAAVSPARRRAGQHRDCLLCASGLAHTPVAAQLRCTGFCATSPVRPLSHSNPRSLPTPRSLPPCPIPRPPSQQDIMSTPPVALKASGKVTDAAKCMVEVSEPTPW